MKSSGQRNNNDSKTILAMALIYAEIKLCDIILQEPTLIPVINRFGIALGVGDKNIRTICEDKGLDTDFFLTILNTFINEEFFPEKRLKSFCAGQIVDYLTKTNHYYERFQLPNIERHFNSLVEHSDINSSNLGIIREFFNELKMELLSRIESDHKTWFPHIKELSKIISRQQPEDSEMNLSQCPIEHNPVEEKLDDLKNLFVKHLSGNVDSNLCYGVIFAIYSLEKDIKQHNRIRNRILAPIYEAMKNAQSLN